MGLRRIIKFDLECKFNYYIPIHQMQSLHEKMLKSAELKMPFTLFICFLDLL